MFEYDRSYSQILNLKQIYFIERQKKSNQEDFRASLYDEFHKENKGLWLAEIELESENELFSLPEWIKKEVTGDQKYFNAYLSENPFKFWNNE